MLRTLKLAALAVGVLVLVVAAAGAAYEAIASSRYAAAYPPPGRMVDVGGHRLHISCVGEGNPTVIFESGPANMSADWANVQPVVGAATRTCAYDRAGIAWSDNSPQPREPTQIARELHAPLASAGISGPYVLVGQSFGGLYVRMFADLYLDEVAGMVLVDASHPDMWARAPAELTARMVPSPAIGLAYRAMAHLGFVRLTSTPPPSDCGLAPRQCGEERAWFASARAKDAYVAEMGAPNRDARVRATRTLGVLPLVVLTAADHSAEFGTYAVEVEPIWRQMQTELAELSSNTRHTLVEGSTHSSLQLKDAAVTSAAIDQMVQTIRGGQSLALSETETAQQTTVEGGPDFAAIDRYVESERLAMRVPGLAIGIVQGDRIVHLAGFGQADASGRPVTAQTPFLTASHNKSFTALAVMQLVEAGKVDLDAPVQRYISWFRVADADASARITVRHLLNQSSGFPSFPASAGMVGGDMSEQAIEGGVRGLADVSISRPVGSKYEYSNFNYITLGMLVQAVSGQRYEEYLQQHVLGPLRMQRSYTSQADARPHGLATGYRFWFGVPMPADLTFSRKFAPSDSLAGAASESSSRRADDGLARLASARSEPWLGVAGPGGGAAVLWLAVRRDSVRPW
jgi:CubicO group peptidase (beta-lactamase class C family)/pimeloyl-ACP methyl ester carboxylesterase